MRNLKWNWNKIELGIWNEMRYLKWNWDFRIELEFEMKCDIWNEIEFGTWNYGLELELILKRIENLWLVLGKELDTRKLTYNRSRWIDVEWGNLGGILGAKIRVWQMPLFKFL